MTTLTIKRGDNLNNILDKLWENYEIEEGPPTLIFEEGTHIIGGLKIQGNTLRIILKSTCENCFYTTPTTTC